MAIMEIAWTAALGVDAEMVRRIRAGETYRSVR